MGVCHHDCRSPGPGPGPARPVARAARGLGLSRNPAGAGATRAAEARRGDPAGAAAVGLRLAASELLRRPEPAGGPSESDHSEPPEPGTGSLRRLSLEPQAHWQATMTPGGSPGPGPGAPARSGGPGPQDPSRVGRDRAGGPPAALHWYPRLGRRRWRTVSLSHIRLPRLGILIRGTGRPGPARPPAALHWYPRLGRRRWRTVSLSHIRLPRLGILIRGTGRRPPAGPASLTRRVVRIHRASPAPARQPARADRGPVTSHGNSEPERRPELRAARPGVTVPAQTPAAGQIIRWSWPRRRRSRSP
jgi:hypothetical protein